MPTALELIQAQKVAAVENGPTSESFTLDPDGSAVSFKGIFIDSPMESDSGNMGNATRKGRSLGIQVATVPTGAEQGKKIIKADGSAFYGTTTALYITYIEPDETGISVLWLA